VTARCASTEPDRRRKPKKARTRAVERGDGAGEADAFIDDEGDVDESARRDGGDQGHPAGGGRGQRLGAGIERRHEAAFGQNDDLVPVEEIGQVAIDGVAGAGEIGAAGIDAVEMIDDGAGALAVIVGHGAGGIGLERIEDAQAAQGEEFAQDQGQDGDDERAEHAHADIAEIFIAREEVADQPVGG